MESEEGAGAWLDTEDPELTEWFMEATEELSPVDAEDIFRTLRPGKIQPKGAPRPEHTASGERAMTTEASRRRIRQRMEQAQRAANENSDNS